MGPLYAIPRADSSSEIKKTRGVSPPLPPRTDRSQRPPPRATARAEPCPTPVENIPKRRASRRDLSVGPSSVAEVVYF